ncbi:MAG: GlsB/YeaQ/YmgE family stress response membrane protein [Myxococcota bacterium]
MAIIVWIVFGLVVGLLARALMPGRQPMGLVMTTVLGVVGSLLGGFIGSMLTGYPYDGGLHGAGFVGSLLGALIVLGLVTAVARSRTVGPRV